MRDLCERIIHSAPHTYIPRWAQTDAFARTSRRDAGTHSCTKYTAGAARGRTRCIWGLYKRAAQAHSTWLKFTSMAVALGDNYCLVLMDTQDVVATPMLTNVVFTPSLSILMHKHTVFGGEHVTMVATNYGSCACVTQEGSVWVWRASPRGHIGPEQLPVRISTSSSVWPPSPNVTETSSPVVMCTCYLRGIVFLTADGSIRIRRVYNIECFCYTPPCFNSVRIDMIASGKAHVMALGTSCTLLQLQLHTLTCGVSLLLGAHVFLC